ncbi:hypothetical protein C8035_v001721 [Colletotrichum spinosum]|uniref:C2H2-type domain-containing protein n=1 Tax=Colletotrichum spinosum TaxID=1347390 RepID=A0A4R8QLF8_9PEZI|nr:hypothetical protein C8035_v001721 [Colletotrichum spinosum]
MVFTCGTCWREFPAGWKARDQHFNATGHDTPEYECAMCDEYFSDDEDRVDHEVSDHLFCGECDRHFTNWNAVQQVVFCLLCFRYSGADIHQHRNSSKHRQSSIRCPFCGDDRGTATGLVHHLERGACPRAPLDRDSLYQAVRQRDPNGIISKKLLEYHTPSYVVSEKAYNQSLRAYECYMCHRLFSQLTALNQHLNSPVHQETYYHCPNRDCRKGFSTLAATINHLESESCQFMRFESVQQNVSRILDPGRMIQF